MTKFTTTLPSGEIVARTSKTKAYRFVVAVVTDGPRFVAQDRENAAKADSQAMTEWYTKRADGVEIRMAHTGSRTLYDVWRWSETEAAAWRYATTLHHQGLQAEVFPI